MILCLKEPINSNNNNKLLDLTNTFGNGAGYKSNIKKSRALVYSNNERNQE
jgi:hypothetical protein